MSLGDRELERFGESFLQSFEAIRRSLALYPGNHPKVGEQLERFVKNVHELYRLVGQATFNVVHREFFINGLPLKRLSLTYSRAIAGWETLGLGMVRFGAETTAKSALRFFETLGRSSEEIAAAGGLPALLAREGVEGVRVSGVSTELESEEVEVYALEGVQTSAASTPAEARSRYLDSKSSLAAIVDQAWGTTSDPARMLRTIGVLLEKRLTGRSAVAALLARLREHHEPSWRHALDGAMIAVLMGRALGLDRARLAQLGEAAVLRDVGKLEVSPEALAAVAAPGGADDAARAEYRRHPAEGAKLLLADREADASAAIVALEHHAGFNGRGFPTLGARRGLHAFSRIVAVAAEYDRLAGRRAGASAVLPAEALKRLVQGAGSAFDPAAVRALLGLTGLYPEGTAVELRDGSYGVVVGPGERNWSQPEVAVLKDAAGNEVDPVVVKTSDAWPGPDPSVAAVFPPTMDDGERLLPLRIE